MSEVKTILAGAMEDSEGRVMHPETEDEQVVMGDGKTLKTKIAEILAMFGGYVSKEGDSVINGSLKVHRGVFKTYDFGCISCGTDGHVMIAQNAYKNIDTNKYHYIATHGNMGARGIVFLYGSPGVYWFDMGSVATEADEEFTPTFTRLDMSGGGNVNGMLTVNANGGNGLQLVGTDYVYVPIFKNGADGGRSGYFGYSDNTTKDFTISNDVDGGAISMFAPNGLKVNNQKIPTQHASTTAPTANDGADGDVWDVYV